VATLAGDAGFAMHFGDLVVRIGGKPLGHFFVTGSTGLSPGAASFV
jgi:hypothetical protein